MQSPKDVSPLRVVGTFNPTDYLIDSVDFYPNHSDFVLFHMAVSVLKGLRATPIRATPAARVT